MTETRADLRLRRSLQGARILVALLEPEQVRCVARALEHAGARVRVASTAEAARAELSAAASLDAALLEQAFGDDPFDALPQRLRARARPCLAAVVVPRRDATAIQRALAAGALDVVDHEAPLRRVLETVTRAVEATRRIRALLEDAAAASRARRPRHTVACASPLLQPSEPDVEGAVSAMTDAAALSPRERLILRYIALGYRYQEIGSALSISPRTVKMHAANLRRKTGTADRYELLRKMFRV